MEWLDSTFNLLAVGIGLGGLVGGIFSYRRGAEVKLKDSIISDYKTREEQLEKENVRLEADKAELKQRVTQLEAEKQLPITQLTELIVKNHTDQTSKLSDLTKNIADAASAMNNAVNALTKGRKR